jgi:hypothetical protein
MDRKAEARDAALQHNGRALHVYQDEDGTVTVRGRLAPEVGALLIKALDAARETLYQRARVQVAKAADVSAEPSMWLSPLPVPLKLRMLSCVRVQRSRALMVPTKPDAEPDPGRFEVPHRVDTALAL